MDIDHFKQINDTFNHSIGDKVLKRVADVISHHCREEDLVARWGGEEFVILLPNCDTQAAREICERIRLAVSETECSAIATGISLTISIGVTAYHSDDTLDKLISRADKALYAAKQAGRNHLTLI